MHFLLSDCGVLMHHVSQAHVERSGHGLKPQSLHITTPLLPHSLSLSLYLSGSPPPSAPTPPLLPLSVETLTTTILHKQRERGKPPELGACNTESVTPYRPMAVAESVGGACGGRGQCRAQEAISANQTAARGPDFTPCHVREDGLGAWRLLSRNQVSDHTERHRDGREVGEGRREERVSWEVARKLKTPHVWREEGGTERERKEIVLRFSITNGDTHTHTHTHARTPPERTLGCTLDHSGTSVLVVALQWTPLIDKNLLVH